MSLKSLINLEGPFGNAGFCVGNIGYITAKIALTPLLGGGFAPTPRFSNITFLN